MRGISLDMQVFARTAAETGGQGGRPLVSDAYHPHLFQRPQTTSNVEACSENRYPSPLARSVLPPYSPRRSFLRLVREHAVRGNSPRHARTFAEPVGVREIAYATVQNWRKLTTVITTVRAEQCVNPFSFSPSFPPRRSRGVCPPMVNVPLPVPPLALLSPTRPTATWWPVQRLGRLRAPIATTLASAADRFNLNGRAARRSETVFESFPGREVRGAFSCLKLRIRRGVRTPRPGLT